MLLSALAEIASIGGVAPLLALLANPEGLSRFPWAIAALEALGARSEAARLVAATLVFIAMVTLAGALRLHLAWLTQAFIFRAGHDIAVDVQERILSQPYEFHIRSNSSTLLAGIEKTEQLTSNLLLPLIQALTAAILSLFIVAALFYIDPRITTVTALTFLAAYLLVSRLTRRRLKANSEAVAEAWNTRLQILQESLGGIRDVIIDDARAAHVAAFARANRRLNGALASNAFITNAPRFAIETAGIAVISLIALYAANQSGGFAQAVPALGAVALGAQRLLPLIQQIYSGWATLMGSSGVLSEVLELLRLPLATDDDETADVRPLQLSSGISFDNVSFKYTSRRAFALDTVSVDIPVGSVVGLAGRTGCGKSTMADLLMGLLEPSSGTISIDGRPLTAKTRRPWQRSIAHVPQAIFLADTTIAQNIALADSSSGIDLDRVASAAASAHLDEFVASLPDGYDTMVGERGIRLSGGQRQRLGIARAIYKGAPVLVLDEATSALDEQTEAAVMEELQQLTSGPRTTIVIAHRLSTLARCDVVIRLHEGRIAEVTNNAHANPGATRDARELASKSR